MKDLIEEFFNTFNYEFLMGIPEELIYEEDEGINHFEVKPKWVEFYNEIINGEHPKIYINFLKYNNNQIFINYLINLITNKLNN